MARLRYGLKGGCGSSAKIRHVVLRSAKIGVVTGGTEGPSLLSVSSCNTKQNCGIIYLRVQLARV